MSGAATMNRIDPLCCPEPWPTESFTKPDFWYCQSCGQILTRPANRTNGRERPKVVEEGKATTLNSF